MSEFDEMATKEELTAMLTEFADTLKSAPDTKLNRYLYHWTIDYLAEVQHSLEIMAVMKPKPVIEASVKDIVQECSHPEGCDFVGHCQQAKADNLCKEAR